MKEYYEIIIAALLHDIGKFKQRAFGGQEHSKFPKDVEGIVLPRGESTYYTHRHALWTYDFFENDLRTWNLPKELDWQKIKELASKHHNAGSDEESIIEAADRISAASDRGEKTEYERDALLKRRLRSVFSLVTLDSTNVAYQTEYGYRLQRISSENIFPHQVNQQSLQGEYRTLWDEFIACGRKAFEHYKSDYGLDQFVFLLVSLLHKFCWCIPSATNDQFCDISLFDHATSTAAIALVLKILNNHGESPEKPFVIFAGDITGIQPFIFQHHQKAFKGSAKIIRGRSLCIASIAHAYTYALCRKLGIPPFVQLLNAGGKFTLVLPNRAEIKQKLKEITHEFDEWFFAHYHGDFTIAYDYSIEASQDDLTADNFKNTISKINYNLSRAKSEKFLRILQEGRCIIDIDYGEEELCRACGRYAPMLGKERCEKCEEMFQIGSKITRKSVLAFHEGKGDFVFGNNAISLSILDSIDKPIKAMAFFTLDEGDDTLPLFLCNNYVPLDKNPETGKFETMEFERIAECALHQVTYSDGDEDKVFLRGSKLLAYIKIDVDRMGEIFSRGIKNMSISRYGTLSRMFNVFFTMYVKHLLETKNNYQHFYTVFSGGDDLFLIAPWDEVLHFVDDLNTSFKRFVCENKDIHFSCGVVIQKPSYPMSRAASQVEEKLELAKDAGKNRLSYFVTMTYDEMEKAHEIAHWFVERYEDGNSNVNHAFLYRLLSYVRMAKRVRLGEGMPQDLLFIPMFKYDLVRNIVKKSDNNILNMEEIKKLEEIFNTYTTTYPEILETILQIVLYSTREHSMNKKEE
ncbi:MAG: type III-A CRISPR-associated protein Cas10/Csm1 [Spirochaetes bacterium]|nr:type III-A CRISPR-associated protein Cas10/Csm1 [Spirochaetota bacterium]